MTITPFDDCEPLIDFFQRVEVDGRAVLIGELHAPYLWLAWPMFGARMCLCYDWRDSIRLIDAEKTMAAVRPFVAAFTRPGVPAMPPPADPDAPRLVKQRKPPRPLWG